MTEAPRRSKAAAKVVGLDQCAAPCAEGNSLDQLAERIPDREAAGRLAELFRMLGEPNRARLLFALLEAGELCVCDLAAVIDTPESSVSHALRLLRAGGIVRARRDGRLVHYRLDDAHVRLLLDLTREHLKHTHPDRVGQRHIAGSLRSRVDDFERPSSRGDLSEALGKRHSGAQ